MNGWGCRCRRFNGFNGGDGYRAKRWVIGIIVFYDSVLYFYPIPESDQNVKMMMRMKPEFKSFHACRRRERMGMRRERS